MPGIFQHIGKMAGIGSIEPPSFEQVDDDEDDDDDDFAQSRQQVKKEHKRRISGMGVPSSATSPMNKVVEKDDSDEDSSDGDDMFKGRMGYEDFMKKIEKHQKDIFK